MAEPKEGNRTHRPPPTPGRSTSGIKSSRDRDDQLAPQTRSKTRRAGWLCASASFAADGSVVPPAPIAPPAPVGSVTPPPAPPSGVSFPAALGSSAGAQASWCRGASAATPSPATPPPAAVPPTSAPKPPVPGIVTPAIAPAPLASESKKETAKVPASTPGSKTVPQATVHLQKKPTASASKSVAPGASITVAPQAAPAAEGDVSPGHWRTRARSVARRHGHPGLDDARLGRTAVRKVNRASTTVLARFFSSAAV